MGRNYTGRVASSNRVNQFMASSREAPHISAEGCSPPQKAGRCGWPNTLQRSSSSSCTHGTPAGLPFGMPGRREVMDGAMQQAAQEGRQFIGIGAKVIARQFTSTLRIRRRVNMKTNCPQKFPATKLLDNNSENG